MFKKQQSSLKAMRIKQLLLTYTLNNTGDLMIRSYICFNSQSLEYSTETNVKKPILLWMKAAGTEPNSAASTDI